MIPSCLKECSPKKQHQDEDEGPSLISLRQSNDCCRRLIADH